MLALSIWLLAIGRRGVPGFQELNAKLLNAKPHLENRRASVHR
jgi:hypothetical protein